MWFTDLFLIQRVSFPSVNQDDHELSWTEKRSFIENEKSSHDNLRLKKHGNIVEKSLVYIG